MRGNYARSQSKIYAAGIYEFRGVKAHKSLPVVFGAKCVRVANRAEAAITPMTKVGPKEMLGRTEPNGVVRVRIFGKKAFVRAALGSAGAGRLIS